MAAFDAQWRKQWVENTKNVDDITAGTTKGPKTSQPNSMYIQQTPQGNVKNVYYYDENGNVFSREDYIQDSKHWVEIDGKRYNLKNVPHEHQIRAVKGPNGQYFKEQVRILNQLGHPITP